MSVEKFRKHYDQHKKINEYQNNENKKWQNILFV